MSSLPGGTLDPQSLLTAPQADGALRGLRELLAADQKPSYVLQTNDASPTAYVAVSNDSAIVFAVYGANGRPAEGVAFTLTAVPANGGGRWRSAAAPAGDGVSSVALPTDASGQVAVYPTDTTAGDSGTVTAEVHGSRTVSLRTGLLTVLPGPASRLALTTPPPKEPAAGAGTIPLTVQLEDRDGNPVCAPAGGVFLAPQTTSSTGVFAATPGGDPIRSITIPAGSSRVRFYHRDPTLGTPLITVTGKGVTPDW